MAAEKEEIILEFTIDQGKAFDDLTRVRKSMQLIKEEQKELQKAYSKGTITLEEYVQEQVRQEQILKREQKTYADLTKVINTNSNSLDAQRLKLSQLTAERNRTNKSTAEGVKQVQALDKQILKLNQDISKAEQKGGDFRRSIGTYTQSIKDAAGQINIAGVNVGSLTSQLAAFANPATAAVGITTALFTAYARSTIGAKDLEYAQNQLSAATEILTNDFAAFISSVEDGDGAISKFTTSALIYLSPVAGALAKISADAKELLEDLGREELEIRAGIADRLEENQELLTFISDEQQSINDKLNATNVIEANLINNKAEIVDILEKEKAQLVILQKINVNDEKLKTAILQKKLEIQRVETQTTKQIEKNNKLQDDLNIKLQEELRLRKLVRNQGGRNVEGISTSRRPDTSQIGSDVTISDQDAVFNKAQVKLNNDQYLQDARNYTDALEFKKNAQRQFFEETESVFRDTSELFKKGSAAQKGFALASIGIDTGEAIAHLVEASEGNPANAFTFGGAAALQYAAGLIRIFTNIAAAKELVGFSEGGFTGHGNPRSAAGLVHKNEVVWNAEDVARAGGPTAANQMRPTYGRRQSVTSGYYDGGVVTNKATSEINQSLAMANAIKMMPTPIIGVKEFTKVANRVRVKQSQSRI